MQHHVWPKIASLPKFPGVNLLSQKQYLLKASSLSFFSGKAFAGSSYAAKPAANDPASEIQRLLASYANHWCSLEKEIKETKSKQGQAQQVRTTSLPHFFCRSTTRQCRSCTAPRRA